VNQLTFNQLVIRVKISDQGDGSKTVKIHVRVPEDNFHNKSVFITNGLTHPSLMEWQSKDELQWKSIVKDMHYHSRNKWGDKVSKKLKHTQLFKNVPDSQTSQADPEY